MTLSQPAAGPSWLPAFARSIIAEVERRRKAAVRTVTASGDVLTSDDVVLVDASSAPVSMALPDAVVARGCRVLVKKIDASANAVTVTAAAIDGSPSVSTTVQYVAWTLAADGGGWWIT